MTRRQFLKSIGAAAAAPAVAKLDWLDGATGHGWSVIDMGDYLILRIRDDVTVADQHFSKPTMVEGGDGWMLTRSTFDGQVSIQTGNRFVFSESRITALPGAEFGVSTGHAVEHGSFIGLTIDAGGGAGFHASGPPVSRTVHVKQPDTHSAIGKV